MRKQNLLKTIFKHKCLHIYDLFYILIKFKIKNDKIILFSIFPNR